ncbi:MAG: chemotaxis protein [Planctomycetota bacterium]
MSGSSNASSTPGDILLDAGTNELEVLVFQLDGGWFGVNVAKVREVVRGSEPTQSPGSPPGVLGMLNMRGELIPVIDLRARLGMMPCEIENIENLRIVITEFNGVRAGFIVDAVDQIHRVSWSSVKTVPEMNSLGRFPGESLSSCTGTIELDERLILMLDFESVADSVRFQDKLHVESVENPDNVDRESKVVILAEDSPFMRETVIRVLQASGYQGVRAFGDGLSAFKEIERIARSEDQALDAIISDIEMPQMDGLHLTKRVRELPAVAKTPIVLFSSLISSDNLKKGQQVGADAQVAKPELPEMVRLVDLAVTGRVSELVDTPIADRQVDGLAA